LTANNNNHYILSVGNGIDDDTRSNALAVTSQGKLQLGGNDALGSVAAVDIDTLLAALKKMGILSG
jgi:hypothetical protein